MYQNRRENSDLGEKKTEKPFIHAGSTWESVLYHALFGFCVGDALGVPVEFSTREEREEDPVYGMRAYGTYGQPAGTWSDDTSLMLCLVDAINQGYSIQKAADNFVNFYKNGAFTPYGEVFDIGNTTRNAIEKMCIGENPVDCGSRSDIDNGNGSLMRVLPIAFYGLHMRDMELISLIEDISSLTHGHPCSRFACIFYVRFSIQLLAGVMKGETRQDAKEEALDRTIEFMKKCCFETYSDEWNHYERILSKKILGLTENEINSTGYVVDTLEAVLWTFFHADSYREVVLKAVNLGGDTDTAAAIAGGIAGIYYCFGDTIPEEWIQSIAKKEELYQMFQRFYRVCISERGGACEQSGK